MDETRSDTRVTNRVSSESFMDHSLLSYLSSYLLTPSQRDDHLTRRTTDETEGTF